MANDGINISASTVAVLNPVPTAAAPEITAPSTEAVEDPSGVIPAPTDEIPVPIPVTSVAEANAPSIPTLIPPLLAKAELSWFDRAFTTLLLTLEIVVPIVFAPLEDSPAPANAPRVTSVKPVIVLYVILSGFGARFITFCLLS